MTTKCSDPAVLAGLFLAAYSGNLADVKSALKNNAFSADVADPEKVRACKRKSLSPLLVGRRKAQHQATRFWIEKPIAICFMYIYFLSLLSHTCGLCLVQWQR